MPTVVFESRAPSYVCSSKPRIGTKEVRESLKLLWQIFQVVSFQGLLHIYIGTGQTELYNLKELNFLSKHVKYIHRFISVRNEMKSHLCLTAPKLTKFGLQQSPANPFLKSSASASMRSRRIFSSSDFPTKSNFRAMQRRMARV